MSVNSKNYLDKRERRDEIEDLLAKANSIAWHLQDMYNDINTEIEQYEQEQAALDE